MEKFLNLALEMKEQLVEWRRDFHQHPELGYEEVRTSSKIKEFLKKEGIEYREVAGTGICALIRGKGTKTIGVRADMDALPLEDKKNCAYASKNKGKMHACGHDAHTTILLGVAKILNQHKDSLRGNVKLFFEPAEETTGGARVMIQEGILENPHVDAVIGLHVSEEIMAGKIGIKKGAVHAASNPFSVKIIGKGSHGAHPDSGIDPIAISAQVIQALQMIVSREIPPTDAAVVTVGSIHGGTAANIIPEEVVITGILRTMKKEHREYVKRRLREIVEGIVTAMRGKCEIVIEESYPCVYNDDTMVELMLKAAKKEIGEDNIQVLENPSMGVESFAYFSMERPSAFYFLGVRNEEKGIVHPAHGCFFDIDEDALPIGVAIQCQGVYDFLNS